MTNVVDLNGNPVNVDAGPETQDVGPLMIRLKLEMPDLPEPAPAPSITGLGVVVFFTTMAAVFMLVSALM